MKRYYFLIAICLYSSIASAQVTDDRTLTYNADGFVASEKTTLSNQDDITKYYKYPKDYVLPPVYSCTTMPIVTQGLIKLIGVNNISTPTETYSVLHKYGTSTTEVTEGQIITFGANGYPYQSYRIETAVPLSSFTPSYYNSSTCDIIKDSHYALQETDTKYDNYGNLLEKNTRGNKNISFMYSYKGAYKIADVDNASNAQIAYTSFETADQGFWSYTPSSIITFGISGAIAGNKAFNLTASELINNANTLPMGNYVVSFWRKAYGTTPPPPPFLSVDPSGSSPVDNTVIGATISGWVYEEHHISNMTGVTIAGIGYYIDELRLYPENAEMQTYCYNPLIGVSYTCDVAGHFTYYEYDDLNRLVIVRDQNGNIKKKIDYRLQQAE